MTYQPAAASDEWLRRGVGLAHDRGLIAALRMHGVPVNFYPGDEHEARDLAVNQLDQAPLCFYALFGRPPNVEKVGDLSVSTRDPAVWVRAADFGQTTSLLGLPTVRCEQSQTGCILEICQGFDAQSRDREAPSKFLVRDLMPNEHGTIKLDLVRFEPEEKSQWQASDERFGS